MELHLVGGFLGSGKTTAIIGAARELMVHGKKVGVVTNDQGKYLVDTAFFQMSGVPAVEVTGGCFCCNYDDLDACLDQLRSEVRPDVVFAESVGSCGDLVATVVRPLLALRGSDSASSLTTFVDSRLLQMRLKGEELPFSENVVYIFDKQIEEASLLVINKIDLLEAAEVEELAQLAQNHYPDKTILPSNSLSAEDVRAWVKRIESGVQALPSASVEMDYQRYGAGEAQLAWLDEEVHFNLPGEEARPAAIHLIAAVLERLQAKNAAIGHLKFILAAGDVEVKASFTTLEEPDWRLHIPALPGTQLNVMVNARVEIGATLLNEIVQTAIAETTAAYNAVCSQSKLQYFHPGFPRPTHRMQ